MQRMLRSVPMILRVRLANCRLKKIVLPETYFYPRKRGRFLASRKARPSGIRARCLALPSHSRSIAHSAFLQLESCLVLTHLGTGERSCVLQACARLRPAMLAAQSQTSRIACGHEYKGNSCEEFRRMPHLHRREISDALAFAADQNAS
jgi:hypothetical protein